MAPKVTLTGDLQGKAKFLERPLCLALMVVLHLSSVGTSNISPLKSWGMTEQSPLGWGRNLAADLATMNFVIHKQIQ